MATDYNKIGNDKKSDVPKPPRMSPAELAKRQRAVNEERLKAAAKTQPAREVPTAIVTPEQRKQIVEQPKAKKTKDEREREFIVAIEMILGHPLFEWQKEWLKEIRKLSFEGRPINVTLADVRKRRGY